VLLGTSATSTVSKQINFPTIFTINCNSMAKHNAKQMLTADITASGADIIVVTETHFKSRYDNTVSNIDGFNCFRLDRVKRKGGGVCVYTDFT